MLNRQIQLEPLAVDVRRASKAIGISSRLLWSKTKSGEVPHFRVGRRVLYRIADLEYWLAEQATKTKGAAR